MIMPMADTSTGVARDAWPVTAGSYLLVLELPRSTNVRIGALGPVALPSGLYIYAGSARGPGGLRARVQRHLAGGRRLRWHIDWLRRVARVRAVWIRPGRERLECVWAQALDQVAGLDVPVPRFGASDCRCPAHLCCYDGTLEAFSELVRSLPAAPWCAWQHGRRMESQKEGVE